MDQIWCHIIYGAIYLLRSLEPKFVGSQLVSMVINLNIISTSALKTDNFESNFDHYPEINLLGCWIPAGIQGGTLVK